MEKVKRLLISPRASIRHALKQMDEAGWKILFAVDRTNKILGVVTDGDIRRWILKGGSLKEPLKKVMNSSPVILNEDYKLEEAKKIMLEKAVECIPIVNAKSEVTSAIWWFDLFEKKIKPCADINLPVVIMAGGEGTRLAPFTKILPKALVPIGDKPIIELIIERFREYNCKDFYLSVNYKSNIIKAYLNDINKDHSIHYIQEQTPLGTAGSLHLLKNTIKSTFFLSNCDILIEADFADILKFHRVNKNKITLVGSLKHYRIPYGICKTKVSGTLKKITEKPEYDFLVNTGMYILEPEVMKLVPSDRVFHVTDLINQLLRKKARIGVYPISEKSWIDMGQIEELKETLQRFGV